MEVDSTPSLVRSHGTGVLADSGACAAPAPRPRRILETRAAALRRRLGEGPYRDPGDAPVPLVRSGRPRVPDRGTGTRRPRGDRVHVPPPGRPGVVVSNGFFGDRVREVLLSHRVKAEVVASPWGAGPDIPALREALKTRPKAVAVIHNETSTGITNPLEPIVEAAHAVDAAVIVDAVSSLGGLSLPFSKLGIDAAFTASPKCIAAPAGIAPIAVANSLCESTDRQSINGWHLNLYTWDRYEREWGER